MPDGGTLRIGADLTGRVRVLRQRTAIEDTRYRRRALELLAPVRNRVRRMPGRNIRPQLLADLEAQWHRELGSDFRIACETELSKHELLIHEAAICAARVECPDWVGDEASLAIVCGRIEADSRGVSMDTRPTVLFSQHAIARFFQRNPSTTTDADLLDAIAAALGHAPDAVPVDQGFTISTEAGGRWAGRCIVADGWRMLACRTWLA